MTARILVLGGGAFAREIVMALPGAWRRQLGGLTVHLGSRDAERARWLALLGNSRSRALGANAVFQTHRIDWGSGDQLCELIGRLSPDIIVHTASLQSVWTLRPDTAWFHLVRHGGYGVTAALQGALFPALQRAIEGAGYQGPLVNACYPDLMNAAATRLGLTVTCGLGNIALVAEQLIEFLDGREDIRVLAGHWDVEQACRPPRDRLDHPLAWIGAKPVATEQLSDCPPLSGDSSMNALSAGVSGAVIRALVTQESLRGVHLPGVKGLPGGYPVVIEKGEIQIDLPRGLSQIEAERWNLDRSKRDGAFLSERGVVTFSDTVAEMLDAVAPDLARGFDVGDVETAAEEFSALRAELERRAPSALGWDRVQPATLSPK